MADPGQISWFVPFPDVVRRRPGLPTNEQGFFGSSPQFTIPNFGYFEALSEPVRFKAALKIGDQRDFFPGLVPIPTVPPSFGYFQALSEPVRFKIGLAVREQPSFTSGFIPIPLVPPAFDYFQEWRNPIWLKRILTDENPFFFEYDFPITVWQVMCAKVNVLEWTADISINDTNWSKEDTPI